MISKNNTHLVIKNEDIRKYCNEMQIAQLSAICETVSLGRLDEGKELNSYYICNTDEPYSDKVLQDILQGESYKKYVVERN